MDKYYVQSGTVRCLVQADTARKAALWAVHQVMQQVLPLDHDALPAAHATPGVLAGLVRVSRRGFDRDDATELVTMEVLSDWNQMVTTLDRLEKMLYQSAA